jgi:hypothetical protein
MKLNHALTLALTLTAAAAQAQSVTYDWAFTGSSFGDASGTVTFSGPIDSDTNTFAFSGYGYDYIPTAMTGTINGSDPFLSFNSAKFNFANATAPAADPLSQLYNYNFKFNVADGVISFFNVYNLGINNGAVAGTGTGKYTPNSGSDSYDAGNDTFTLSIPVPEPTTLALTAAGALSLLALRRQQA